MPSATSCVPAFVSSVCPPVVAFSSVTSGLPLERRLAGRLPSISEPALRPIIGLQNLSCRACCSLLGSCGGPSAAALGCHSVAADVPVPGGGGLPNRNPPDANPAQFLAASRASCRAARVKPAQIAAELRRASALPRIRAGARPLTADAWSRAVFHRTIAPADLVVAILGSPRGMALLRPCGRDDRR